MSSGSVSFIGLNSSFDSGALISQLVNLETQSRILPLEVKKRDLQIESSSLDTVTGLVNDLRAALDYDNVKTGDTSLAPKSITSTDTDNTFLTVTATDAAVAQTFDVNISQLATATKRESDAAIKTDLTNASNNSAAHFKAGVTLSDGTVTVNGETRTFSNASGTIADIETFLAGFSGVTSATFNTTTGQMDIVFASGSGNNFSSSGDTSNMIAALGLDNAQISGANVSGIQNLEAVKSTTTLNALGFTGTKLTINGTDVSYDSSVSGDTLADLISAINDSSGSKVDAAYDAINGKLLLTNTSTGALSLTITDDVADADAGLLNIEASGSETLGNNAEFTISTLNGGSTLVSNDNEVTGLMEGVTLDLTKVTTSAQTITIAEDATGYREKVEAVFDAVNSLILNLRATNDTFSRGFEAQIKNVMTKIVGVSGTDTYTSLIDLGLESDLDPGDFSFLGYSLDATLFDTAFKDSPESLNKLLFGDDDTATIYDPLSNGDDGILTQLNTLIESYVNPSVPSDGIISQVQSSISNQIDTIDDRIARAEDSIDSLETRLRRQFSQLDLINAEFQQQQAAIANLAPAQ